jgi:hypothetical protein
MKHLNRLEARMNVPWQIVIASADLEDRRTMVNILEKQELDPIVASSVADCQQSMAQGHVGLIFCARSLADGDYRDLLLAARASKRRTRIVLTARITDWDEYLDAMRVRSTSSRLPAVQPTWNGWSCKRCATNTLEPGRSHLCNRRQARCRKTPYTNQRDAEFLNALTLKRLATLRAPRSLHEYESTARGRGAYASSASSRKRKRITSPGSRR